MAWIKIRKFVRFYLLAFLSALFLLILTIVTFWEIQKRVAERNKNLFHLRTEAATTAIKKRMQDYIQILKGGQGLFEVSDSVTREEWKGYVQTIHVDEHYPGIQGIGYTLLVSPQHLASFEERIQNNGFPQFKVWPEQERSLYTSILYLEPFDARNQRAFGYDMFTDSTRREAMERARDTGEPALSAMVTLVQETEVGVQKGFLLYLPLYKKGTAPATAQDRRKLITGYVYSPFRVNDLMNGILGNRYPELNLEIYDGSLIAPHTLLYIKDSAGVDSKASEPNLQRTSSIQIGGHAWKLHFTPLSDFGYDTVFPYFVLGGGLLISALIFIIMFSLSNIEKSDYLKQVITDNASAALFIVDTKGYCTFMNPAAEVLTGYSFQEAHDHTLHALLHHSYPDGSPYPAQHCPITQVLSAQGAIDRHEDVFIHKNGTRFYANVNAQPIYENKRIVAYLIEVRDISQEKKAEIALKEKNRNLQTLNNIGINLSAELDLKKLLQVITDSCTELTGAEFGAFFYQQINEKGESYMLYTLSGVDPEAFAHFPMPRKTKIFAPTFHGEGIIRSDDITLDERYGQNPPYHGMPEGHLPVKSYLSVPVISRNGTVLGSLFFGHHKPAVFTKGTEEIVKGIAAQAAIAIDNSQLFETIRTKNDELVRINNDLDNFVYTASHDLKAPVLNIEGLVHTLKSALKEKNTEKVQLVIKMMKISVLKFKETIQALTEVSKAKSDLDDEKQWVRLPELLHDIELSIQDVIQESDASIRATFECPAVRFSQANLRSVLLNLITNAIKYRSPLRKPVIDISCKRENEKILLKVSDNGLGIPEHYLSKVFMMFKRYHSHVEGTGIGLYLVKRIVENHGGSVEVKSQVDQGTVFTIILPDQS